jgi:glycosyltransferase involved in cell wall biosynthesis/beta-glucosidase/6-phospho-beta-glucosidase/beta-galactosidase
VHRHIPFLTGFESTYLPLHGVDVTQTTGHETMWRRDVNHALQAGARTLRYPLRWHEIEREPGRYDWTVADDVLGHLQAGGASVILDLLHHTDYPDHLADGFRDRRFASAFVAYAEQAARRYPWAQGYTVINEPLATLFLAGHEALWPPYDRGIAGFVGLLRNVLPALATASACWREMVPDAQHVWIDTCEHHRGAPGAGQRHAALANDRRHIILDLALGVHLEENRPFLGELLSGGGEDLLQLQPVQVDVLGLDYYCHSEWFYDHHGAVAPSPVPLGFAALAGHYHRRYGLPLMLSETNIRGLPSDRVTWLRYMLEQYETAVAGGVPLQGFCWFPHVDSCDWDSLLARPGGRADPVGVVGLDRATTCFTDAWTAAANGAGSVDLPAYELQSPCRERLAGYLPQMASWPWRPPPAESTVPALTVDPCRKETTVAPGPDLVVLSHLRWNFVWQRPQHLISRLATTRARTGARTWFVEEPMRAHVEEPTLRHQSAGPVTRVWLEVPPDTPGPDLLTFGCSGSQGYGALLALLLAAQGRPPAPDVWVYTPMALDVAVALEGGRLIYDVMDDLSSFLNAPRGLLLRERRLLANADVVFTGGRSLHEQVAQQRTGGCHLFPSGVEPRHYARSRMLRRPRRTPVAGFVGVIDERMDLSLVSGLAASLADWRIEVVGPVAKISPDSLPYAPNLVWPGPKAYADLPAVMAGFDVALMPFALNAATRSISPTKTLEYLAAGLPVVSTRVPDVVADYPGLVHIADDAPSFAAACREVLTQPVQERDRRLGTVLNARDWDTIAGAMEAILEALPAPSGGVLEGEATA